MTPHNDTTGTPLQVLVRFVPLDFADPRVAASEQRREEDARRAAGQLAARRETTQRRLKAKLRMLVEFHEKYCF